MSTTQLGSGEWLEWGGDGPLLHLAHGNGFPPGTYRRLAAELTRSFRVASASARPLWGDHPPESLASWQVLADDLMRQLRSRGHAGVIGVGHSLGAVTSLLAAARAPELFSALVLIEPVLLTGIGSWGWRVLKALGLRRMLPLARAARRRRDRWPSRAAVRRAYAAMPLFSSWRPEVLDDYLAVGLVEAPGGGVTLRYPREWEARVFEVAPHDAWPELETVGCPVVVVQGGRTDPFLRPVAGRAREVLGAERVVVLEDATHCAPMERPEAIARLVRDRFGS